MPLTTDQILAGIGIGANVGQGFGSTLADASIASATNAAARRFQREVYQNRYQWTVGDLERAGLNPVLAVGGLSPGASSAPIVGARAQTGPPSNVISSARQAQQIKAEVRKSKAEAQVAEQEALNRTEVWNLLDKQQRTETVRALDLESQIQLRAQQMGLYSAQMQESVSRSVLNYLSGEMTKTYLPGRKIEAGIDREAYGEWMRLLRRFVEAGSPFIGEPRRYY